jgi:Ni,Fe-hydrogenase I cytochrome b subunit
MTDLSAEYGFGKYNTLGEFVGLITPVAFSIASIMVVFYFIIGAFELVTSQGDKAHIVSARSKIYHSMIGFILLIVIFLVMQYLPQQLGLTEDFKLF